MPLTNIQRKVIEVLRPFRNENNYVAGGAALNQRWPRLSDDMDIFQDQRNQLPDQVGLELQALRDAGLDVEINVETDLIVDVTVREDVFETRVEWSDDFGTCRRFFPAVVDDELGFRLHQADLAVNKVLCASLRREAARDAVDIANIVRRYAPLGPLVWAAMAKEETSPPEVFRGLRDNIFGYSDEEIRAVRMADDRVLTRDELRETLAPALDAAQKYCDEMAPQDYSGCLFVDDNECPIEADEDAVESGLAVAMPIKDFPLVPIIGDGQPAID